MDLSMPFGLNSNLDFSNISAQNNVSNFQTGLNKAVTGFNILGGLHNMFYNSRLQRKTWDREDSAIQRRVADAKAAGLSPLSVLGSGASSGQIVNANHSPVDLSQMNTFHSERLNRELQREQMKQQDRFHSGELNVANYNAHTQRLLAINDLVETSGNLDFKNKELKLATQRLVFDEANAEANRSHNAEMIKYQAEHDFNLSAFNHEQQKSILALTHHYDLKKQSEQNRFEKDMRLLLQSREFQNNVYRDKLKYYFEQYQRLNELEHQGNQQAKERKIKWYNAISDTITGLVKGIGEILPF